MKVENLDIYLYKLRVEHICVTASKCVLSLMDDDSSYG